MTLAVDEETSKMFAESVTVNVSLVPDEAVVVVPDEDVEVPEVFPVFAPFPEVEVVEPEDSDSLVEIWLSQAVKIKTSVMIKKIVFFIKMPPFH